MPNQAPDLADHDRLLGLWRAAVGAVEDAVEATRAAEPTRPAATWTTVAGDARFGAPLN